MSSRAIVHEPAPEPHGWMLEGVVPGYPVSTGTQVRVRQTGAGIEVGAFPGLEPAQVEQARTKLLWWMVWYANRINKPPSWNGLEEPANLLVIVLPDNGEPPHMGFYNTDDAPTAPVGELATVMLSYLNGRR